MIKDAFLWIFFIFIVIFATASHGGEFSLTLENDVLAKTDRHYTHGTRFLYLFDDFDDFNFENRCNRFGIGLSQYMYTPSDIRVEETIEDDRPYGGWLYVNLLLISRDKNVMDMAGVDMGIVGPSSGAKETQKFVHKLLDNTDPQGWDNQIKDELGLNLTYQRKYKWVKNGIVDFDAIGYGGGSLGNVFTYVDIGGMIRMGHNIPDDFGYIKLEPSARVAEIRAFLFANVEGRYVLRNIFVEGNTFKDSHGMDRESMVSDTILGASFGFGRFELVYGHNFRSKEFKGQDEPNAFGTIMLNWKY